MELLLQREETIGDTTLGDLYVDGNHFCVTLEDEVRIDNPATTDNEGSKIYGKTAIPAGSYKLAITWSEKFKKRMILVEDVSGFTGIRIHSGNDVEDTLGCILVGQVKLNRERITGGTNILPILFGRIDGALSIGKNVSLTVVNAPVTVAAI